MIRKVTEHECIIDIKEGLYEAVVEAKMWYYPATEDTSASWRTSWKLIRLTEIMEDGSQAMAELTTKIEMTIDKEVDGIDWDEID